MKQQQNLRSLLYQYQWLWFRTGLPGFSRVEEAQNSINLLRQYVNVGPEWDPEYNRLYRVRTLLAGISGPLENKTKRTLEQDRILKLIHEFQEPLSVRWGAIQNHAFPVFQSDADVRRELQAYYNSPNKLAFQRVKSYCEKKFRKTVDPNQKEELRSYLLLMDQVDGTVDRVVPIEDIEESTGPAGQPDSFCPEDEQAA